MLAVCIKVATSSSRERCFSLRWGPENTLQWDGQFKTHTICKLCRACFTVGCDTTRVGLTLLQSPHEWEALSGYRRHPIDAVYCPQVSQGVSKQATCVMRLLSSWLPLASSPNCMSSGSLSWPLSASCSNPWLLAWLPSLTCGPSLLEDKHAHSLLIQLDIYGNQVSGHLPVSLSGSYKQLMQRGQWRKVPCSRLSLGSHPGDEPSATARETSFSSRNQRTI